MGSQRPRGRGWCSPSVPPAWRSSEPAGEARRLRATRLIVAGSPVCRPAALRVGIAALTVLSIASAMRAEPGDRESPVRRVVSMNPSLTEILIALDATSSLVGVDAYSKKMSPEVADLPTVGGLFNPSLEAVVALEPNLVVLVPSAQQRGFVERLEALGIDVLVLANITLDEIFTTIEILGERVDRAQSAARLVTRIRESWRLVREATAERPRQRAVLVIQREPLYVVGGGSFIDAMMTAAGADNVAASFDAPYPRVAVEWLIAAAPDVILDADANSPDPSAYWSRWPSLPAVANGRTVPVVAADITLPGPTLDRAVRILADAIHGNDTPVDDAIGRDALRGTAP